MIKKATEDQAFCILNEDKNIRSIGLITEELKYQPYLCQIENFKMLFFYWPIKQKGACEVHIACAGDSILKSRVMAKEIINHLFSLGYKRVTTHCPQGRIANMAFKVGMVEYQRQGARIYFERLSWV
jgi:hypothetical protein